MNEKQRKILSELVEQYNQLYQSEPDLKKYSEYAITYHSKADRLKYMDTLYNAQENGNMTPFYDFMLRQYVKFLKSEIRPDK